FTGLRQWGRPDFRVASLWQHGAELQAARELARAAARRGELEGLAAAVQCPGGASGPVPAA
ncbi:MAG: hypothetical protein ACHQHM_02100, partial [Thermoanaerobaculales bacterium]